jgi:hypothetical protein
VRQEKRLRMMSVMESVEMVVDLLLVKR